jgi:hypothetical protein
MSGLKVTRVHYRDLTGNLLWSEPMFAARLHGPEESMVADSVTYVIKRVAIANTIQHVNMRKATRAELRNISVWGSHEAG